MSKNDKAMGDNERHLDGPIPPASADPLPGGEPAHEDPIAPGQDPGDQIVSPRADAVPDDTGRGGKGVNRESVVEWLRANGFDREAERVNG